MNKNRLEAFSDGVLAIIITIMVLEIKVPHSSDWMVLQPLIPTFISYILSFIFVGIYWANHHHLLHSVKRVTGGMIWANINLLFWLSLIPFATGWMGENHFAPNTVSVYGLLLLLSGVAFTILQKIVEKNAIDKEKLQKAFIHLNRKGYTSVVVYLLAIPLAYVNPAISAVLFLCVSIMWLVPDKHLENALAADE
jgi:uncharacterized membrane protein